MSPVAVGRCFRLYAGSVFLALCNGLKIRMISFTFKKHTFSPPKAMLFER